MGSKQEPPNSSADRLSILWIDWVRDQRITWLIAAVFVLAPGILLASPFLPMAVLILGVFARTLIAIIFYIFSKKHLQITARSIFILFLTSVSVIVYGFQIDKLIPINATPVVEAVEKFRIDNGYYPGSLEEIVPKYLSVMPSIKPTIWQPSTRYRLSSGKPIFQIASIAGDAFAIYEYDFESKVWKHHS